MQDGYIVLTNNPLVFEKLNSTHELIYKEVSYEEILKEARDMIHRGHQLLTHPLSGSVKPNETPYKSMLLSKSKGRMDQASVRLIEYALDACKKFHFRGDQFQSDVYEDFQMIDWTLLESGMTSADVWR
ncbi:GrdX family protein [uncultured Merdimonas sp.]|uniref:GrdX family protein n=1 Tax=uncultured Merdimonas sp. TaxID=2023269 RepID=UPI00320A59D7